MKLSHLIKPCLNFLYPAFCLHCDAKVKSPDTLLCPACFDLIEWLEADPSCPLCAVPLHGQQPGRCASCRQKPVYLQPHASLFASEGPILDLYVEFQTRQTTRLAKLFASFFVVALNRLPWPLPEVIVPIPDSCIEVWSEKKQASVWIAKELSDLLDVPYALPFQHGEKLILKKKARPLPEKKVLLLTADLKEGTVVQQAKWRTQELFTKNIYSLALIEKRNTLESSPGFVGRHSPDLSL